MEMALEKELVWSKVKESAPEIRQSGAETLRLLHQEREPVSQMSADRPVGISTSLAMRSAIALTNRLLGSLLIRYDFSSCLLSC